MAEHRETVQLMAVQDYLKSVYNHPTAQQVFEAVRKEVPNITLATVYRNLDKLARSGQALKLEVNGEFRFDGHPELHQHCVCSKCGLVMDFDNPKISENAMKNFNSRKFRATSVSIKFLGLCEKCKR